MRKTLPAVEDLDRTDPSVTRVVLPLDPRVIWADVKAKARIRKVHEAVGDPVGLSPGEFAILEAAYAPEVSEGVEIVWLTHLIFRLNAAIDSGKHDAISLEEVISEIRSGSILDFLEQRLAEPLSLLPTSARVELVEALQRFELTTRFARRKFGVQNRGLCLLIALLTQLVRQ
jgi:hypothetical protein